MNNDIDFVITWVDGNDKKWKEEMKKYLNDSELDKCDAREMRYRDTGTLKYLFRGIEKYAPWVHKVYFVTCGQIPKWLDTSNPKLVIVNHKDYIPSKYLPTFNSNAIENMFHKIKGLSNQFVYFNDDMFILKKVKKTDFFKNGLPCESMVLRPIVANNRIDPSYYYRKISNDMGIINKYFPFRKSLKKNFFKYVNIHQGRYFIENIFFLRFKNFIGFNDTHCPSAYLKETFNDVWKAEPEILNKTMTCRFRNNTDCVNHWLFKFWQFASGKFNQRSVNFTRALSIKNNLSPSIIRKRKYHLICLNDSSTCPNYDERINEIIEAFESVFPKKSSFEK